MVLEDVGLLSEVLTLFLRALFALQRWRTRRRGLRGGQVGAVSFIQFFGSALQVTPHFHSLVPDGVFVPGEGGVRFEALPPPTQGEVERLLRGVRHRVLQCSHPLGAQPELLDGGLLKRHYRKETLDSEAARREWVAPDVAPLPGFP